MVATGFLKPKDSVLLCCVEGWEQRVLVLLMSSPSPTPASFHLDHPQHPCLPRFLQPVQPSAAKQSFLILCFHPVMSLLRNPQGLPTTSITGPHSSLGFQTQCNLVSLSQSDGFPLLVLASPGSTRTGPLPGPCTTCHHS